MILIGERWSGKSTSGNTILGNEHFESGRTRTLQSELGHSEVEGRKIIVVDTPGWNNSPSLSENPEIEKQRFKLNVAKCPPGPHAILLVIPLDTAFTEEHRKPLEENLKLLGKQVWNHTIVLFPCGDFLGPKNIEEHIESEGEALKWLVEKCGNRYHVFNNHERENSQVTKLLKMIDEMVWNNKSGYYKIDENTLLSIRLKQEEVTGRAKERKSRAEEQRHQLKAQILESKKAMSELKMVLLGSRNVGKTSLGNTILGVNKPEPGKRTAYSVIQSGYVDGTAVTVVDTPGWWKGFSVSDTPELIKQEVMCSMFLCPPGPGVFLLVMDADTSFNRRDGDAVMGHLELLGVEVWKHTMVVFTKGDWLGNRLIEEYIEGEGEALKSVVEKCGNRYHIIDNKNGDDGTQVTELLEKSQETIASNHWNHFVPDEKKNLVIKERRERVEEGAKRRLQKVERRRELLEGKVNLLSTHHLQEMTVVIVGQKTVGKSASGNNILGKEVFATYQNRHSDVGKGECAGRSVTVIDTLGWWKKSSWCTQETDVEIGKAVSRCLPGAHAVLLVIPVDMAFTEEQKKALEEHMVLFGDDVWAHTLLLFTFGDRLADRTIEEHIEREQLSLQRLVDMCGNRYHVFDNNMKNDVSQVIHLFEKIDEMVAENKGQLYTPDMEQINERIEDKFKKLELKEVLKQRLEQEYKRRELELKRDFRQTLADLIDMLPGTKQTAPRRTSREWSSTAYCIT
ncbi:GTPase IMAP family member 8-like [Aplochiton taeniatus]